MAQAGQARAARGGGGGMTAVIPAGVEIARDLVGPALSAAVSRLSPEVGEVAAYHLGLTYVPSSADGARAAGSAVNGSAAIPGPRHSAANNNAANNNAAHNSAANNNAGHNSAAHNSAARSSAATKGAASNGAARNGAVTNGAARNGAAENGGAAPAKPGGAGKALRPALALLSARAAGEEAERGVPAAVAVELVHNFSLLHDDIMDGDTERRHRPTAWTVYGVGAAILAGDALLALAQDILLEENAAQGLWAARCLSAAVHRLIAGQGADLAFERRDDVTLPECLEMAGDKTAALMACACSIGAIHVGAPASLAMGLAGFGAHVGLAFQLTDDLLGIWGAPERTGKPIGSDLRARKKSLPVVAALASGGPAAARLRELLTQETPLTDGDVALATRLVEDAGGKSWTEAEAETQLAAAGKCLAEAEVPADVRAEFASIAEFITARDT